jgi:hypothetical protein
MPRGVKRAAEIYVAKHGFACSLDGEEVRVAEGERVRRGHPLLRDHEAMFKPVDEGVHYDVEQATAAPGELRGDR